jgi:hypothetical protein
MPTTKTITGRPPGIYETSERRVVFATVRLDVPVFIGLSERGPLYTAVALDSEATFASLFGRPLVGLKLPLAVRLFFANGGRRCLVVRCLNQAEARCRLLNLPGYEVENHPNANNSPPFAARNPGAWGNALGLRVRLRRESSALQLEKEESYLSRDPSLTVGDTLQLKGPAATSDFHGPLPLVHVSAVETQPDGKRRVRFHSPIPKGFAIEALLNTAERLTIQLDVLLQGRLVEQWSNAALHPDHPRFLPRLLGRRAASEQLLPPSVDGEPDDPAEDVDRLWGEHGDPWGSEFLRPSLLWQDQPIHPPASWFLQPSGVSSPPLTNQDKHNAGTDGNQEFTREHFFDPSPSKATGGPAPSNPFPHRFELFRHRRGPLAARGALERWDGAHPFEPAAMVCLPDLIHPSAPKSWKAEAGPISDPLCFSSSCSSPLKHSTENALPYPGLGFDISQIGDSQGHLITAQARVIESCERSGQRVALLDLPPGLDAVALHKWRERLASDRAALYAPWLRLDQEGVATDVPPSPLACAVAAGQERRVGVWAAPANVTLEQVFARRRDSRLPDTGLLHEVRINEVRSTPQGLRILGSRTTSLDLDWTHLSVRRLIDWVRLQIAADLQWVPFEPNSPALWAAMAGTARRRLLALLQLGALAGKNEAEAFFIRCDRSTNSPIDLERGRVQMLVGVSPAVPAEFILFRLVRHGQDVIETEAL